MKTYKSQAVEYKLRKINHGVPKVKIMSSKDAQHYIRNYFFEDIGIYESFFILLLNRSNNVMGWTKIGQGGIAGTFIDIRIIAKYAIDSLSSSVILAHNHPSGNTNPSNEDEKLTERISQALELLDVKVLDHIILTEDGYFSFADEGLMN